MAPFTTAFQTAVAACVTDIILEGSARGVPLAEGGCLPVERNPFPTLSRSWIFCLQRFSGESGPLTSKALRGLGCICGSRITPCTSGRREALK